MLYVWIILGLLIVYFLACYVGFRFAMVRSKELDEAAQEEMLLEKLDKWKDEVIAGLEWYKEAKGRAVTITSYDGLKLIGRLIVNPSPKGTIILCHGYRSAAPYDFGCAAQFYYSLGYNLLLIDQRSHQRSQGKYICYGIKERFDCRDWANWARKNCGYDMPIVLGGISMGASTVLMASGLELPKNVVGIVADCGFTSPWDIIKIVARKLHLPFGVLGPTMNTISKLLAKMDLKEYSTIDALKANRLPVLFIHGKADKFVPMEMTERNYQACAAPKTLLLVDDAGHGMSYLVDGISYKKAVSKFLNELI